MASESIEMFRFAAIRKATPDAPKLEYSVPYYSWDKWQEESGAASDVISTFADIRSTNDPEDVLPQLTEQANSYRSDGTALANVEAVNAIFPNYVQMYSWLTAQEEGSFDYSDVQAKSSEITGSLISAIGVIGVKLRRLWESLTIESIQQSNPTLSDTVIRTMRTALVLLQPDGDNYSEKVFSALSLPMQLPSTVFPFYLPHPNPEMTDNPVNDVNTEIVVLKADVQKYVIAIADLKKTFALRVEQTRWAYNSYSPAADDDGVIDPTLVPVTTADYYDVWYSTNLAPATITLFSAHFHVGTTEHISIRFLIETLERTLNEKTEKLNSFAKFEDTVTGINGLIVKFPLGLNPNEPADPVSPYPPDPFPVPCKVSPIGIADYKRVVQKLVCYKPGEIAHIENVMKSEHKDRTTRELRQREETVFTSVENETEDIRDLQTTNRFELQQESSRVMQQDSQFQAGVNFSAQYGTMQLDGGTSFAVNTSKAEAERSAMTYARSVTERAMQRIMLRTREEKTVRVFQEFEESNKHAFDNTAGADHIVGLYRWVNKEYECRIKDYGKRMMFSFMVPEPASFHIYANMVNAAAGMTINKPRDPRTEGIDSGNNTMITLADASGLTETNYLLWTSAYGATDFDVYPQSSIIIGKSYFQDAPHNNQESTGSRDDIQLPDGYKAVNGWLRYFSGARSSATDVGNMKVLLGRNQSWEGGPSNTSAAMPVYVMLNEEEKSVPLNYVGYRTASYGINVEIQCVPTMMHINSWKNKTYAAIMAAYQQRKLEYEEALTRLKVDTDVYVNGTNPLRLRDVEVAELKKGCIQLLNDEYYFDQFDAARNPKLSGEPWLGGLEYPWFNNCEAMQEGNHVQFFENAFDWRIMSYIFHPYFWAKKKRWTTIYKNEDSDPIFTNFLQSGYAQVLVPVRPGFEELVSYFCSTGKIWKGEEKPPLTAQQYVDMMLDLQKPIDETDKPTDPKWTITLPTNLVILQDSAEGVPGTGLPCDPSGI